MKRFIKSGTWAAACILLLLFSVDAQQLKKSSKQKKTNVERNKSLKKSVIPQPKGFLNDFANALDKENKQE